MVTKIKYTFAHALLSKSTDNGSYFQVSSVYTCTAWKQDKVFRILIPFDSFI